MEPEKHARYLLNYKPNDIFWGLGIENETYFQFSKSYSHPTSGIHSNHKPERYSVNYYVGLDPEYKMHLKEIFPIQQTHHQIPIYINAHTFLKTDISGNHQTTYSKNPQPNPNFTGQTLHTLLCDYNPTVFRDRYKVNYMFDGDTIEFMTQNFYKAKVSDVVEELVREKHFFLASLNDACKALNIFSDFGSIEYPVRNEPFVTFLTNKANIAIFNNGTYHINITLPTKLGPDALPEDDEKFVNQHKNLIRYIQILEPLLIIKYGTPDPFSQVSPKYSLASQRCAVSRYIGIGTYDTDTMHTGKILNIETNMFAHSSMEYWWYKEYHKTSNYLPLPKIGVDINFRKHGVHGIEIRFLDWFPEDQLTHLLKVLTHLCDFSLENPFVDNPIVDPIWNRLVVRALQQGRQLEFEEEEYAYFANIFNIVDVNKRNVLDICSQIEKALFLVKGLCVKEML